MTQPLRAITYFLESVLISSPRLEDDFEISNLVGEINLFENISSPYITGQILVVDSGNISSEINFIGQETLTLKLYVDEDYKLTREFIVYSISNYEKAFNDNVSTYILNIIEKHGYYSYFERLNKSYSGHINDIIYGVYDGVLLDDTDKQLLSKDNFEQPFQNVKVTANNKTPLNFCIWLTKRATTDIGEPFFLYSSLKEGPQFKSLATLLKGDLINPNETFIYTQVQNSTDLSEEKRIITDMNTIDNDNTIKMAKSGAFNLRYISIDPFDKDYTLDTNVIDFDINSHYNRKKQAGSVLGDNIYDDEFIVGPKDRKLSELNSRILAQVNTKKAYGDLKGYAEEGMLSDHLNKVARKSDLAFLDKEKYSITMPGHMFFNKAENTSIGRMMDIIVPADLPLVQKTDEEEMKQPKKSSARFLSMKARHRFSLNNQYYVSLEVAKLED